MNPILQKRIEEAANMTVQNLYDYAKQTRNPKVSAYSEGYLDAIDVQGDFLFREGANYALSNQWISVDEGLPEKRQDVLVAVLDTKSNTYFFGFDNIDDDNGEFLRDKNGFAIENDSHKITHWMEIPSLKGGEK